MGHHVLEMRVVPGIKIGFHLSLSNDKVSVLVVTFDG